MSASIRGIQRITLERLRDARMVPPGATVRIDLGEAEPHELIGDPLNWLGWLVSKAGAIEVIGTDPETITFVMQELPNAIKHQGAA